MSDKQNKDADSPKKLVSRGMAPPSPKKTTGRPSLDGIFPGLNISGSSKTASKPMSAFGNFGVGAFGSGPMGNFKNPKAKPHTPPKTPSSLRRTLRKMKGGFPNWCSLKRPDGGESPLDQLILKHKARMGYDDAKAVAVFESCKQYILEMRDMVKELATSDKDVEDWLSQLWAQEMGTAIFGSNLIEGVGLESFDETLKICNQVFLASGDEIMGGLFDDIPSRSADYQDKFDALVEMHGMKKRERREVVNHACAFKYMVDKVVHQNEPFTEELIKNTHLILCRNDDATNGDTVRPWQEYAGIYRSGNDFVRAGNTGFCPPNKVAGAMRSYVEDLQDTIRIAERSQELDPILVAADACGDFVNIHPFLDGNGRTCRMILNTILLKYAGVAAPIGERDGERKEYLDIARDRSESECGNGRLAAYAAGKLSMRLKDAKSSLSKAIAAANRSGKQGNGGHGDQLDPVL